MSETVTVNRFDLETILYDLRDAYSEAIDTGASHMTMRSAVGAPWHNRVLRLLEEIGGPDDKSPPQPKPGRANNGR